jgi:predicted secreted protein
MAMNIRMIAGVTGLGLSLIAAGCNKTTEDSMPPEKDPGVTEAPAAPAPRLANAAVFECDGGGELQVQFNYGDTQSVTVSLNGAAGVSLPAKDDATEPMYTDGAKTLTVDMDRVLWNDGSSETSCKGVSRPIPPPAAPGVVRDLTEADAGAIIDLKVGDRFSISLSDVPTAGYAWSPERLPVFLKAGDSLGGATTTAQFLPGFAGGNHWIVLVFEATAAGSAELELAQRRPWEDKANPDDKRYKVTVKVR